jgi:hypothetical protein
LAEPAEERIARRVIEADSGILDIQVQNRVLRLCPVLDVDGHADRSAGCELDRVRGEMAEDLHDSHRIAQELPVGARPGLKREFQPLVLRLQPGAVDDAAQSRGQIKRLEIDFELSGLDPREFQYIEDDALQRGARGLHQIDDLGLLGAQGRAAKRIGAPDDGVERGAKLVADIGQEIGLDLRRLGRRLAGAGHFSLVGALGHGAGEGDLDLGRLPRRVPGLHEAEQDRNALAPRADEVERDFLGAAGQGKLRPEPRLHEDAPRRGEKLVKPQAGEVVARVAEHPLGIEVRLHDRMGPVQPDQAAGDLIAQPRRGAPGGRGALGCRGRHAAEGIAPRAAR